MLRSFLRTKISPKRQPLTIRSAVRGQRTPMNVILVSDSPILCRAYRKTLQSTLGVRVAAEVACHGELSAESLEREVDRVVAAVRDLTPEQLRQCIGVVVAGTNTWPHLDALHFPADFGVVVSGLILALPEFRWLFVSPAPKASRGGVPESNVVSASMFLAEMSKLVAREHGAAPSLFDPSGLRNLVKQRALEKSGSGRRESFADRQRCAAAIDDETAYAYFHGLAAYRFGHRVAVITSARSMKVFFGGGSADGAVESVRAWSVVFEDLYLNFNDREEVFELRNLGGKVADGATRSSDPCWREDGTFHLSNLQCRDDRCPGLQKVESRIFVTAGHARGREGREIWQKNLEYLRGGGTRSRVVYKPTAGLFRLWHDAGLAHRKGGQSGLAGGFRWPPPGDAAVDGGPGSDHSTPGRLLKIAERLLARGRAILSNADGVEDAVHAAVLAIDAKELLANRTPTTSLEAVALQHEAEVTAESLFVGVEYNLDLKARFRDVEHEVKAVVAWFNRRRRKRSALNARLLVVERLAERLGNLNQVEEEAECLAAATKLRFDFWVRERPWRWVLWPFLRYLSLVSSLPRLALAVSIWILLFTGAHLIIGNPHGLPFGPRLVLDAVSSSTYSFAALQPTQAWQDVFRGLGPQCLFAFESVVAWLNLGLLVSHLYAIISRR